jgi:hypothetical protein
VVSEKDVFIGRNVVDPILELVGRSRDFGIQFKDSDCQVLRVEMIASQVENKAAKCRKNRSHAFDLLVDKEVFLETVSEQKGIADAEMWHQMIEIGLLIPGAGPQDGRSRLVLEAFLVLDPEGCGFFGNMFQGGNQ